MAEKEERQQRWQAKKNKKAQRPGKFRAEKEWSRKGLRMVERERGKNKKKHRKSLPSRHKSD